MNTKRNSNDGTMEPPSEKTVEDFVRASAEAMEFAMKGEWAKDIDAAAPPIHPLMAHPTAMMAAATVVGMGVTSQVAGMWLGLMKGMSEAGEQATGVDAAPDEEAVTDAPATAKQSKKEPLRVVVDNEKPEAVEQEQTVYTETVSTRESDDLKLISGIGPKLASVLADKGLKSFADIASLSSRKIAALDAELGLDGRIERDDWVGQAKSLMGEAG